MGVYEHLPKVKKIETIDGSGVYRDSLASFPTLRLILNQRQVEALADELWDKAFT